MGYHKEAAKGIGTGTIYIIVIGVVALIVGGLFWGLNVATSDLRGQGEATKQVNSVQNRIGQYEHFFKLDSTIRTNAQISADAQVELDTFTAQYPPSADEGFQITQQRGNLQRNVTGPRQLCISNVNQYNNDSVKYTAAKFKEDTLPWQYDTAVCSDPTLLPPTPSLP